MKRLLYKKDDTLYSVVTTKSSNGPVKIKINDNVRSFTLVDPDSDYATKLKIKINNSLKAFACRPACIGVSNRSRNNYTDNLAKLGIWTGTRFEYKQTILYYNFKKIYRDDLTGIYLADLRYRRFRDNKQYWGTDIGASLDGFNWFYITNEENTYLVKYLAPSNVGLVGSHIEGIYSVSETSVLVILRHNFEYVRESGYWTKFQQVIVTVNGHYEFSNLSDFSIFNENIKVVKNYLFILQSVTHSTTPFPRKFIRFNNDLTYSVLNIPTESVYSYIYDVNYNSVENKIVIQIGIGNQSSQNCLYDEINDSWSTISVPSLFWGLDKSTINGYMLGKYNSRYYLTNDLVNIYYLPNSYRTTEHFSIIWLFFDEITNYYILMVRDSVGTNVLPYFYFRIRDVSLMSDINNWENIENLNSGENPQVIAATTDISIF